MCHSRARMEGKGCRDALESDGGRRVTRCANGDGQSAGLRVVEHLGAEPVRFGGVSQLCSQHCRSLDLCPLAVTAGVPAEVRQRVQRLGRQLLIPRSGKGSLPGPTFAVIAGILLLIEVLVSRGSDTLNLEWLVVGYRSLALTGWLPGPCGAVYLVFTLVGIVLPSDLLHASVPMLGVYAVAADWISRRWYLPASTGLVLLETAQILESPAPQLEVVGALLGMSLATAVGLRVQWSQARVADLEIRAEASRQEAQRAHQIVRDEIAATLHDTVAADLTRVIVTAQSMVRRAPDAGSAMEAGALEEVARDALVHLRALMNTTLSGQASSPQSLEDVVATCRTMLGARGVILDAEPLTIFEQACPLRQLSMLALVLREGSTNALKYARAGSTVGLSFERSEDGSIGLTMVNDIDVVDDIASDVLSGGFGLRNLSTRIALEGGRMHFGSNAGRWMLAAVIPRAPSPHAEEQRGVIAGE